MTFIYVAPGKQEAGDRALLGFASVSKAWLSP